MPYILPVSISGIEQNSIIIASHSYSLELQKLSENSIIYENYDQAKGEYYSTKLKWDGTKFVLNKMHLLLTDSKSPHCNILATMWA
jgi:hypothetical protein